MLYREQLDNMGCGIPNCGHDHTVLFLHAMCHPRSGLNAQYDKSTATLAITCKECDAPVAKVKVASHADS